MKRIDYEKFKTLLLSYSSFDLEDLNSLEKEFGVGVISYFFEKIIDCEDGDEYLRFCDVYLQKEDNLDDGFIVNFGGVFGNISCEKSKYDILPLEEEQKYTKILYEGNNNLSIILVDDGDDISNEENFGYFDSLYPNLDLGMIFASIKDRSSLELLDLVRRLRFSLKDDNIWKNDYDKLKKYVMLCKDGIVDLSILKENFSDLDFSVSLSKEEIDYQLNLLRDFIISKNKLYNANVRLVISLARRCCRKSLIDVEEKVQVGSLGLIRAINKFDYTKNTRVSTYATNWIKQRINRFVAYNGDVIRKPIYVYYNVLKYDAFVNEYFIKYGSVPSDEIVMQSLKFSKRNLERIKSISLGVLSLDSFYGDGTGDNEFTLGEFLVDDDELVEDVVVKKVYCEQLVDVINSFLSDSEKKVFLNRIGWNDEKEKMTLASIGKNRGLTRERIRQIEVSAQKKIKRKIDYDSKKISY